MLKQKKKSRLETLCARCGALCCKYVAIQIDTPTTKGDFEDIRWYISHRDVWVFVDEGDWYLCVERRCRFLSKENTCRVYDDRPRICRRYRTVNCEFHDPKKTYDLKFVRPEQIREYAADYFRKKRAKARAKARRIRGR